MLIIFTFLLLGTGTLAIGLMIADFAGIVSVVRAFTGKHYIVRVIHKKMETN